MRKTISKFIIFLCLFSTFFSGKVFAQISLSVSPQKLDLVLYPGEIFQGMFKIANQNDFPLPISINLLPFSAKEGTGEMEFEETEKDSPVFWFSFEEKEMILEPKETKRINFQIKIPTGVNAGGYYVFVYFEPRFPSTFFTQPGPKVIPIIGVPVLISTSELLLEPVNGKEIEVLEFSISPKERVKILEDIFNFVFENTKNSLASLGVVFAVKEPVIFVTKTLPDSFLVTIKNNDIYHLRPEGEIVLYDIFGKEIGKGELKGQTILPGKTRDFKVELTEKENFSFSQILSFIFLGKTKARLILRAHSPIKKEINLSRNTFDLNFFSLWSIYFVFGFVIIILIGIIFRKRLKLVIKILFKKNE